MNNKVLLISENTIKDESVITANLEGKYILAAIKSAQDMCLQPLLGTKLLNEIYAQVQDGQIEDRIQVLLDDYIRPILLNASIAHIIVNSSLKIKNMGTITTSDTNISTVDLKDIQWLKQQYDYNVDFYNKRCMEYIIKNRNLYPEWPGCHCEGMKGGEINYKTGICLS